MWPRGERPCSAVNYEATATAVENRPGDEVDMLLMKGGRQ